MTSSYRFWPWAVLLGLALTGCTRIENAFYRAIEPDYQATCAETGADTPSKEEVDLEKVAEGFPKITAIEFFPGSDDRALVLQQEGALSVLRLDGEPTRTVVHRFDVESVVEQGLLGLAFHPEFEQNRRVYVNYTPASSNRRFSRISEFRLSPGSPPSLGSERVLLELDQPFANHNAGDLEFGPDGLLYFGFGDGGAANDPRGNGQNRDTLLGTILRVDVDRRGENGAYATPGDNPFGDEVFAYGLRNPWKISFDSRGRLIVADVGQNEWEEISIAGRGENLGWSVMEGRHCFQSEDCDRAGLKEPFVEYGRDLGGSITGGDIYRAEALPGLRGQYVFGDFLTGRIWAVDLPPPGKEEQSREFEILGNWPVLISTFGRNAGGEIFVGDYGAGAIYRLAKASQ